MKAIIISVAFLVVISSCKTIKKGDNNNAWNAYKMNCISIKSSYIHWPWKSNIKDIYNYMPIRKGYAIKDVDTVRGLISISNGWSKYQHVFIEPEGQILEKDLLNYYVIGGHFAGIKQIRLFDDSTDKSNCYTDYFNLFEQYNLKNYWRLLGTKGKVKIYDNFKYDKGYESKNATMTTLILVNKNGVIEIFKQGLFNNLKGTLKRFIKNCYKTQSNSADLHTVREMIDFILDRENEIS